MTTIRPTAATPIRRPVVAPAAARAQAPAKPAPKPDPAKLKEPTTGERMAVDLLWNSMGPISGFMSIGKDVRKLKSDPKHKAAHAIEIAGDLLNIAGGPWTFMFSPMLSGCAWAAGAITKTVGDMMAGELPALGPKPKPNGLQMLRLNALGPVSGIMSIIPDLREFKSDPEHKVAHAIEIAGDILNLASVPLLVMAPYVGVGAWLAGAITKTAGDMMADRD